MATCDVQVEGIGQVTQVPASQLRAVHGRDALEEGDEVIVDLKNGKWAREGAIKRPVRRSNRPCSATMQSFRSATWCSGKTKKKSQSHNSRPLPLFFSKHKRCLLQNVAGQR